MSFTDYMNAEKTSFLINFDLPDTIPKSTANSTRKMCNIQKKKSLEDYGQLRALDCV